MASEFDHFPLSPGAKSRMLLLQASVSATWRTSRRAAEAIAVASDLERDA